MTEYLRIGFIARPHGLKGAVKLDPLTDDVRRFKGMQEGYRVCGRRLCAAAYY